MMRPTEEIPLTTLTECGGCAAKLGADVLQEILGGLTAEAVPSQLLAGLDPPDDAAAFEFSPDLVVLATVDFFPPVVNDPYTYGSIAAANAVSDIFAMGGRVILALNIAAIPESIPQSSVEAMFAGGSATVCAAGGFIAGGHTIRDREPKYGLAVIGAATRSSLMLKRNAAPGDTLLLTKPLGTGLIVSGHRQGHVTDDQLTTATETMLELNRTAAMVLVDCGVRAATDVTGFGLLGHALEMSVASGVQVTIDAQSLPAVSGALELASSGLHTGGSEHNRRYVEPSLDRRGLIAMELEALAFDPQTSGGLLASVPAERLALVEDRLNAERQNYWRVGSVKDGAGIVLES